jgi:hypothetical protein
VQRVKLALLALLALQEQQVLQVQLGQRERKGFQELL